jgi:hypothetical protein
MGRDGEIGHVTSLQDIICSTSKKQLNQLKNKYLLTTTELGFLSKVLLNREVAHDY